MKDETIKKIEEIYEVIHTGLCNELNNIDDGYETKSKEMILSIVTPTVSKVEDKEAIDIQEKIEKILTEGLGIKEEYTGGNYSVGGIEAVTLDGGYSLTSIVEKLSTLIQESNEEAVRYGMALELDVINGFINEGTNFGELKFYLLGRYDAMKTALDNQNLSTKLESNEGEGKLEENPSA